MMINAFVLFALVFGLLIVAAHYGERQARARRLRRMMEAMSRISYDDLLIPTLLPPGIFQTGTLRPSYHYRIPIRRDVTLASVNTDDGIELTGTLRLTHMSFEPVVWRYTYPVIDDASNE